MSKGELTGVPKETDEGELIGMAFEEKTDTPRPTVGRPSIYSEELAASIISQIMEGKSTRKICEQDGMPNRDTLYGWLARNSVFSDQYVRACKIRREEKFEKLEDIADVEEDVQRARLKIDVIKWQLSKEEPKKYGDKIDMTSDGEKLGVVLSADQSEQLLRARAARNEADS